MSSQSVCKLSLCLAALVTLWPILKALTTARPISEQSKMCFPEAELIGFRWPSDEWDCFAETVFHVN